MLVDASFSTPLPAAERLLSQAGSRKYGQITPVPEKKGDITQHLHNVKVTVSRMKSDSKNLIRQWRMLKLLPDAKTGYTRHQ